MPTTRPISSCWQSVQFESVDFGYEAERPILGHVSFEIPAGHTVALLDHQGPKSTISRLLYRFYDVNAGQLYR